MVIHQHNQTRLKHTTRNHTTASTKIQSINSNTVTGQHYQRLSCLQKLIAHVVYPPDIIRCAKGKKNFCAVTISQNMIFYLPLPKSM